MQKLFNALLKVVQFINDLSYWSKIALPAFVTFCFTMECILNPQGAWNFAMCALIDVIVAGMPVTGENYQIANILLAFSQNYPFIGLGVIMEVMSTLFVILVMFTTVKMIRFVRG
jgi:hypothetical protein